MSRQVHRAAHERVWVNQAVGWTCTLAMGGPWWLFRRAHLMHHARTDTPEDPERYGHGTVWPLPLRWMTGNWSYYRLFPILPRREKAACVAAVAVIAGMVLYAPVAVGLAWILPMQVATGLFAINTVFLPHGRYRDVVMSTFPVITGFHDDHHARPAYPWHQYPALHTWRAERTLELAA